MRIGLGFFGEAGDIAVSSQGYQGDERSTRRTIREKDTTQLLIHESTGSLRAARLEKIHKGGGRRREQPVANSNATRISR